jgi:hypothetical protein
MRAFGAVAGGGQALLQLFRDHHRPVLAARAADADREVALAFVDVVRQQAGGPVGDLRALAVLKDLSTAAFIELCYIAFESHPNVPQEHL